MIYLSNGDIIVGDILGVDRSGIIVEFPCEIRMTYDEDDGEVTSFSLMPFLQPFVSLELPFRIAINANHVITVANAYKSVEQAYTKTVEKMTQALMDNDDGENDETEETNQEPDQPGAEPESAFPTFIKGTKQYLH